MNTANPIRANWPFPAVIPPASCSACADPRPDCMGAVTPGVGDKCAVHIGGGVHRVPELEAAIEAGNHSGDSEAETDAIHAAETAVKALERTVLAYQRAGFGSLALDPVQLALTEVEYSLREVRS